MTYLITQIIFYLLAAATFGFFWGWLVRGMACSQQRKHEQSDSKELASQLRGLEKENNALEHKIEWLEASNMDLNARLIDVIQPELVNKKSESGEPEASPKAPEDPSEQGIASIPGIRNSVASLRKHNINTNMDLLEAGNTLRGRAELAALIDVDEIVIRHWVSTADIMRIPEITPFAAGRLVDAGIHSILALRSSDSESVMSQLDNVPTEDSGSSVTLKKLRQWIEQAQSLDVMTGIAPSSAADDEYLVDEIEGIGPVYRKRLAGLHVLTTLDLLQRGVSEEGRAQLGEAISLKPDVIDRWVSMADLLRIPGVSGREGRVLQAAGYKAVSELNHIKAEDLFFELQKACSETANLGAAPTEARLEQWISHSSSMHDIL